MLVISGLEYLFFLPCIRLLDGLEIFLNLANSISSSRSMNFANVEFKWEALGYTASCLAYLLSFFEILSQFKCFDFDLMWKSLVLVTTVRARYAILEIFSPVWLNHLKCHERK